jgi:prephenate dehydrogenase
MIAYTSQLAHVLSNAYVKNPSAQRHRGFSANSFQDMTRVAYLNETMWTELFLQNRDYLAEEVELLAGRLLEYGSAIRAGDETKLNVLLKEGRICKEKLEQGGD